MKQLICAALLLLCVACSKNTEEKLFGMWQMKQVEYQGEITPVDTVFYNFQHGLFKYMIIDQPQDTTRHCYGGIISDTDHILTLRLFNDPKPLGEFMPYIDWPSAERSFYIDKLNGSKMILTSDEKTYYFIKY